jgi:hypothetical protein
VAFFDHGPVRYLGATLEIHAIDGRGGDWYSKGYGRITVHPARAYPDRRDVVDTTYPPEDDDGCDDDGDPGEEPRAMASMSATAEPTWETLISGSRARLAAVLPQFVGVDHPIAGLLAAMIALSQCRITVAQRPRSTKAKVTVFPDPTGDADGKILVGLVRETVSNNASLVWAPSRMPAGKLIDERGFVSFVAELVKAGARHDAIVEMAKLVSAALDKLDDTIRPLAVDHLQAVLARDLPGIRDTALSLGWVEHWLLAPERSGSSERAEIIRHRRRAMERHGDQKHILMKPVVTRSIDMGVSPPATLRLYSEAEEDNRRSRGSRRCRHCGGVP